MIKAGASHKEAIIRYCSGEPNINLFILADIELYGFDCPFQEIWIDGNPMSTVALRYHDSLIVYGKTLVDVDGVLSLLKENAIGSISGKASVIAQLHPHVADSYDLREMNFARLTDDRCLLPMPEFSPDGNANRIEEDAIQVATSSDAYAIAEVYGQIDAFKGLYADDVNKRCEQIENRIRNKEGKHVFIKKDGKIIAHGNTAGENKFSAMIGGVLTLPEEGHKGYARKIISYLCRDLLSRDKEACLFYTEQTKELFTDLGFEDIEKWAVLGGKNEKATGITE